MLKTFIKTHKYDILLLALLSSIFILIKFALLGITRTPESYTIIRYLPESLSDMLASVFRMYPNSGYRALATYIIPYIEFQLFHFNHQAWLVIGLALSNLLIILSYILARIITNNRIVAFFSALFFFSYYNKIHLTDTDTCALNGNIHNMNFYLISLIFFILHINQGNKLYHSSSVVFFALALMCKEIAVTLPVLLILYLLIYKNDLVEASCNKFIETFSASSNVKKYLTLLQDKRFLFVHLLPYFIVCSVYLLFRVIIPLINGGTFNTPAGSGLAFNSKCIVMNIINIFFYTFQIPLQFLLFEDYSYTINYLDKMSRLSIGLNILMLGLAAALLIVLIVQGRLRNKTVLFGLVFYITNVSLFVFFRASTLYPFHITLSLIGTSIIFAESVRIIHDNLTSLNYSKKYLKSTIPSSLFLFLTLLCFVNAYDGRINFVTAWENNKTVRLFQSVYDALPKLEDRKPNTIIYIKDSENILKEEGYDLFSMCILPSYKGIKNIKMYHSHQINHWQTELVQYKPTDWNIVVLKYVDIDSIVNITNKETVKEVLDYMENENLCEIMAQMLPSAYVAWNMDDTVLNAVTAKKGRYNATSFNTMMVEGHAGKARYFNGRDSYILTPVNFQGWKGVTIALWVKPERKDGDELSVVLDNGHDAKNNFAIQSADSSGGKWVWHCNGTDIFLNLPINKWSHVLAVADGENGMIQAYINGSKVNEVKTDKGFGFGPMPLTLGRLAKVDARYFQGSIDEVVIWNKAVGIRN